MTPSPTPTTEVYLAAGYRWAVPDVSSVMSRFFLAVAWSQAQMGDMAGSDCNCTMDPGFAVRQAAAAAGTKRMGGKLAMMSDPSMKQNRDATW